MGYSCSQDAAVTADLLWIECLASTGCSNAYVGTDDVKRFIEIGRENRDGAITGTVFRMYAKGTAVPSGSIRIEADGSWTRKPPRFPNARTSVAFL